MTSVTGKKVWSEFKEIQKEKHPVKLIWYTDYILNYEILIFFGKLTVLKHQWAYNQSGRKFDLCKMEQEIYLCDCFYIIHWQFSISVKFL